MKILTQQGQGIQKLYNRNLIAQKKHINEKVSRIIDDVRHSTPKKFGEKSDYGKAKYSLPYFLANGFETIEDEFQVLLRKK